MKKITFLLILGLVLFVNCDSFAQSIKTIPYAYGKYEFFGMKGFYSGLIVYDNKLFIQLSFYGGQMTYYDGTNFHDLLDVKKSEFFYEGTYSPPFIFQNKIFQQYGYDEMYLLQYDSTGFTLIPNPDLPFFSYYSAVYPPFFEFENNLFFRYIHPSSSLARFDGDSISIISLPDSVRSITSDESSIIYKQNLYWVFNCNNRNYLAKYNGVTFDLIPNPDFIVSRENTGVLGYPIVFRDNLYLRYSTLSGINLAKYNGKSITIIKNPTSDDVFFNDRIIYHENLYFVYGYGYGATQLAKYNGLSISLIPNPETIDSLNSGGVSGDMIEYNNKLYFRYLNKYHNYQLAEYDGRNIRLIANPDTSFALNYSGIQSGYRMEPIVFKGILYWTYLNEFNYYQLAQFDGWQLTLIPNPRSSYKSNAGFTGNSIIFNNELYLIYRDNENVYKLAILTDPKIIQIDTISDFKFYPNPVIDNITFEFSSELSGCGITFFDINGRLVLKRPITENKMQFDVSNLYSGVYFIQINGNKNFEVKKFIKF